MNSSMQNTPCDLCGEVLSEKEHYCTQLNRELDAAITFIWVVKGKNIKWVRSGGIDHLRAAITTIEDTIGALESKI